MSTSRPFQSFLGGLGLSLPVHALLLLNGNVFGISGFLHRAFLGSKEAMASAAGLLLGGIFVGIIEGAGPQPFPLTFPRLILSGLLVGAGTKVIKILPYCCQNLNRLDGERLYLRVIVGMFFVSTFPSNSVLGI